MPISMQSVGRRGACLPSSDWPEMQDNRRVPVWMCGMKSTSLCTKAAQSSDFALRDRDRSASGTPYLVVPTLLTSPSPTSSRSNEEDSRRLDAPISLTYTTSPSTIPRRRIALDKSYCYRAVQLLQARWERGCLPLLGNSTGFGAPLKPSACKQRGWSSAATLPVWLILCP